MRALVNGVQRFLDVDDQSLVPEGASMREKPTLSSLADIAQVVFLCRR
jgi:hypothetical protein